MSILSFIKGIYAGAKKKSDVKKVSEIKYDKSYHKASSVSKTPIAKTSKHASDENFGASFLTSAATGNAPLGMVIGGSVAGAMLGASMSSSNDSSSSESSRSSRCDSYESRSSYNSYDSGSSSDSYSSSSCDSSSSSSSSWD